ncbi:MAG: CDP-glucose 4,6-dehydratase [Pseudomonadota bacterium]
MSRLPDPAFWSKKRVLLTGQTGFKGSWAALWLSELGASVTGFALPAETTPHLFGLAGIEDRITHLEGDLRDAEAVDNAVIAAKPDLVIHMAAQAIVGRAIRDPIETYGANLIGTGHLLDALRRFSPDAHCLVCTSDKVYRNDDTGRAFVESDPLGGKDPYSASKAATELLVSSWRATYPGGALATARAGNVIGGGDFSEARIIPDIVRAAAAGEPVILRHPEATRPWQHVLDCLGGYFLHTEAIAGSADLPALNIGPEPEPVTTVREAAEVITAALGSPGWAHQPVPGSVEMKMLSLDATAARQALGWSDRLTRDEALHWTADWYRAWLDGADMASVSEAQLKAFLEATP